MKTAEEWNKDFWSRDFNGPTPAVHDCFKKLFREIQIDALQEVARVIQKRAGDYDKENGSTDHETGAREYPRGGDEYMADMEEISEAILALATQLTKKGK